MKIMSLTTDAEIDRINVGDTATCEWTVTAEQVDAFARFSLDTNPLHMSDDFAREGGFSGRVAHGMLTLSAISRLIGTQLPGPGSLWMSQETNFAAPVFLNDQIQARVTVKTVSRSAQVVVLQTDAINLQTQAVVLRGTAKVRIVQR